MTLNAFIDKWRGKTLDWDGKYGGQCVDLYRAYCKEVLDIPQSPPVVGAKDIWDTYLKDYFDRIGNTPSGIPIKGDVVIWGTGIGTYGHVAVFLDGDAKKFKSFDQNFPKGAKCETVEHTYRGVLGWLRPKKIEQPDDELDRILKFLSEKEVLNEGTIREMYGDWKDTRKQGGYKDQIEDLQKSLLEKQTTLKDKDGIISGLQTVVTKLERQIKIIQKVKETLAGDDCLNCSPDWAVIETEVKEAVENESKVVEAEQRAKRAEENYNKTYQQLTSLDGELTKLEGQLKSSGEEIKRLEKIVKKQEDIIKLKEVIGLKERIIKWLKKLASKFPKN